MTTPYYLQLHQGTGIGVRVLINDLPFYIGKGDESVTVTAPANHLFVPGENVVVVELFPAERPSFAPFLTGPFRFSVFTDDEARTRVHHVAWPEEWEVGEQARRKAVAAALPEGEIDLTPPRDPPLPYLHVSRFPIDAGNARPVYLDAPKVDFGPEGLPEQHEAVRRILRSFQSGDPDAFLAEHALKLEERQRAYPESGAFSASHQRANVADHFSKPWRVRPTEMKELVFGRRADGRVAHVTRAVDGYALEATSDDPEDSYFGTDLFLTQQNGVWRLFR